MRNEIKQIGRKSGTIWICPTGQVPQAPPAPPPLEDDAPADPQPESSDA